MNRETCNKQKSALGGKCRPYQLQISKCKVNKRDRRGEGDQKKENKEVKEKIELLEC